MIASIRYTTQSLVLSISIQISEKLNQAGFTPPPPPELFLPNGRVVYISFKLHSWNLTKQLNKWNNCETSYDPNCLGINSLVFKTVGYYWFFLFTVSIHNFLSRYMRDCVSGHFYFWDAVQDVLLGFSYVFRISFYFFDFTVRYFYGK